MTDWIWSEKQDVCFLDLVTRLAYFSETQSREQGKSHHFFGCRVDYICQASSKCFISVLQIQKMPLICQKSPGIFLTQTIVYCLEHILLISVRVGV